MYTREEVQKKFLKHIAGMIDYWASVDRHDSCTSAPRHTNGNVRLRFQAYVMRIAILLAHWAGGRFDQQSRARLEGLAHSILVALDGYAMTLPAFVVAPALHPLDRSYCIENGENFYPEAPEVPCDIAGELHEQMYAYIRQASQC
jgi:hypothetical protein